MKRYLDRDEVEDFIKLNFRSKKDFAKAWGVSYSHFLKMLRGLGECGPSSIKKLKNLLDSEFDDWSVEDLLEPIPILIGDRNIKGIAVMNKYNELLAYIDSSVEICGDDIVVEYILC